MKVTTVSHHDITLIEFKKNSKKYAKFGAWRQVSKTINFALLFNATAPTLATMLENNGFTEDECLEYITSIGKLNLLRELISKNKGKLSLKKARFLCASQLMIDAFFETYTGIRDRIPREIEFAKKHGYSRAWHGPVRHLPELRFMKYSSEGQLMGADRYLYSRMSSHSQNQAANSTIQTMEARVAFATIHNIIMYLKEWKLKSFFWNTVHDSCDLLVWKPELELVCSMMQACAAWKREPHRGVNMCMDITVADPSFGNEHNYYKGGTEDIKFPPIEKAVENWNKAHPENIISWHGCTI